MLSVHPPGRSDDIASERRSRQPGAELTHAHGAVGTARPIARPDDVLGPLLARTVETRAVKMWRNAAPAMPGRRILQRVSQEQIEAEARRLWKRKGGLGQTQEEQNADWQLAIKNTNEIEAEARRLYEEKNVGDQSVVDQQRDWAAAVHTVRQRRLAEEEYGRKGRRRTQTAQDDWRIAGEQLAIEELWEHCDPNLRLPGEDDQAATARVVAAKLALKQTPDYQPAMVDALLAHEHGQTPRPFVSAATEDTYGGHTVAKHVKTGSEDDERRRLATRVITHWSSANGPCPGKACAFEDLQAANDAIAAALQLLWRKNGGWGAPDGWRDRFARGKPFKGNVVLSVPIRALMQVKNPWDNLPFPVAQHPVYFDNPHAVGGRPLFPGDPLYGAGNIPARKQNKAAVVVWDTNNPLTVNGQGSSEIAIRIFASAAAPGGWYVNSAWPE